MSDENDLSPPVRTARRADNDHAEAPEAPPRKKAAPKKSRVAYADRCRTLERHIDQLQRQIGTAAALLRKAIGPDLAEAAVEPLIVVALEMLGEEP